MVDHLAVQIDGRVVRGEIFVQGVAPGVHRAVQDHDIAHAQLANVGFGERRGKVKLAARRREPFAFGHFRRVLVPEQPAVDRARVRIKMDAQAPKRPAVVGDGDEERGGQAVQALRSCSQAV